MIVNLKITTDETVQCDVKVLLSYTAERLTKQDLIEILETTIRMLKHNNTHD